MSTANILDFILGEYQQFSVEPYTGSQTTVTYFDTIVSSVEYRISGYDVSVYADAGRVTEIEEGVLSNQLTFFRDTFYTSETGVDIITGFRLNSATYEGTVYVDIKVIGGYTTAMTTVELPVTYDISASDIVINLDAINGRVQTKRIYWKDGNGSNDITITPDGTDKLDFGDALLSSVTGEGTGYIDLESDGTNWKVVSYNDSGSNANGEWEKSLNGKLFQYQGGLSTVTSTVSANHFGTTAGNAYLDVVVHTFPILFNSIIKVDTVLDRIGGGGGSGPTYSSGVTTSGFSAVIVGSNGSTAGYSWEAIGRWRT